MDNMIKVTLASGEKAAILAVSAIPANYWLKHSRAYLLSPVNKNNQHVWPLNLKYLTSNGGINSRTKDDGYYLAMIDARFIETDKNELGEISL